MNPIFEKNTLSTNSIVAKFAYIIYEWSQSMTNGVEMKLPINAPNINLDKPTSSESIWKLIKVFFRNNPNLIPHQVRLSPTTKKLLIRLQDGTTRQDLEDLKVSMHLGSVVFWSFYIGVSKLA